MQIGTLFQDSTKRSALQKQEGKDSGSRKVFSAQEGGEESPMKVTKGAPGMKDRRVSRQARPEGSGRMDPGR